MASDFYYFISSLPSLRFGEKAALSWQDFLQRCQERLSAEECAGLAALSLEPLAPQEGEPPLIRDWKLAERYLRNLLAAQRARKRRLDENTYLRPSDIFSVQLGKRVEEIMLLPNAWEREQALDQLRWQRLDELAFGHDFNFEALIVYAYRLLILEKLARQDEEKGAAFAAELLAKALPERP
ncbi:MAG: DUF2764 family protein [Lentisphaeria bacterium]